MTIIRFILLKISILISFSCFGQINDTWDAVKVGSTDIRKIYVGSSLVWEKLSQNDSDFLVVVYNWTTGSGRDLDTGTEFTNSNISGLDGDAVGYGLGYTTTDSILTHAGDNTSSGDESFLIDLSKLKNDYYSIIPNETYIDMYGTWFSYIGTGNVTVLIKTYKGGTMSKSGYTWINTGGELQSTTTINTIVESIIDYSPTWRSDYTYLGKIVYKKLSDVVSYQL